MLVLARSSLYASINDGYERRYNEEVIHSRYSCPQVKSTALLSNLSKYQMKTETGAATARITELEEPGGASKMNVPLLGELRFL